MGLADRLLSKTAWLIAALFIAAFGFAPSARAATGDTADCSQLATLALRYTGGASAGGGNRPNPLVMWATDHCRDDAVEATPLLEKTLRDNRFTLPGR